MPDTVQVTGNELKVLKVDEAVNTTFVCEVKNRMGVSRDQVTALVRGGFEHVQVTTEHRQRPALDYSGLFWIITD